MERVKRAKINESRNLCMNHRSLRKEAEKMRAGLKLIKMDEPCPGGSGQNSPNIRVSGAPSPELAFGYRGKKIGVVRFAKAREDRSIDPLLLCSTYALVPEEKEDFFSAEDRLKGNGNILYARNVCFYRESERSRMLGKGEFLYADVLAIGRKFDPSVGWDEGEMGRFERELKRLFDLACLHGIQALVIGDLTSFFGLGSEFVVKFGEILFRLATQSGIEDITLSLPKAIDCRRNFFWEVPIESMNLGKPRYCTVLKRSGIETIGKLSSIGNNEIWKVRNIGRPAVIEVKRALSRLGLKLRDDE